MPHNLIKLSEVVRPHKLQFHRYFRGLKHQTYLSHASRVQKKVLSLHWPARIQAERDSLAGLSEVLTSQTPSLIPNTGDWYNEPNQATEQQPQHPGLTHLRRRLGLPLQPAVLQPADVPLRIDQGAAEEQGETSAQQQRQTARQQFSICTYEVSLKSAYAMT